MSVEESYIKDPKTFKEQLNILESRGLIIDDDQEAISFLERVNYYRLSAYGLNLKRSDNYEKFKKGTSFRQLVALYNFDRKLRELLIGKLEMIEISFRTHIAYYLAHTYGSLGYKDPNNFRSLEHHQEFINNLDRLIHENRHELFVSHHKEKYNGEFPIWVAIEVTSFGALSKLYRNMKNKDKLLIANEYYNLHYKYIQSWLHTLSYIRNICAHYGRLYGRRLVIRPMLFNDILSFMDNYKLFAVIFAMTHLLKRKEQIYCVTDLKALMDEYGEYIDLAYIGFSEDWEQILRSN